MSENYKDHDWGPQQFRLYADTRIHEIDRELEEHTAMAEGLSRRVFQDQGMARALLEARERSSGHFSDVTDSLMEAPHRLGDLQRAFYRGIGVSQEVRDDAKRLAVVLQRHRDLLIARDRYERLTDKAIQAERTHPVERADAVQDLRMERQYCDVSRSTRDVEHRDRLERDWPMPPEPERGGGGGSPPVGGQAGGGSAGGSSSRSWWRGEAKEQDPVREERREPQAAQRRWWREEQPARTEEPEREPDREDDRFKR